MKSRQFGSFYQFWGGHFPSKNLRILEGNTESEHPRALIPNGRRNLIRALADEMRRMAPMATLRRSPEHFPFGVTDD
jgi:hypothetical protein